MIEKLKTENVGIIPEMEIRFAQRINVVTGDNGLGKTFLLDLAWWALTRTWSSNKAQPSSPSVKASIEYVVKGTSKSVPVSSTYRRSDASWPLKKSRPPKQGIVVYVRIDGGFSVWDPARNYWRDDADRPDAFHFDSDQVWSGLSIHGIKVCEGLERDWVAWQKDDGRPFRALVNVLKRLSPPGETIRPGPPQRVFLGEGWDRPTLKIGDQVVPVALASAGVRRILALAYFLVWSWYEHRQAAKFLGKTPEDRYIILFDEPETHLHPKWQRTVIPSILESLIWLRTSRRSAPQIILATHAPLVLASLEPLFDPEIDDLLHLHLDGDNIAISQDCWEKQGDVSNWLVSEVFGLQQARSSEAEIAIESAEAFMRNEGEYKAESIHERLQKLLPDHDPFWPRWVMYRENVVNNND